MRLVVGITGATGVIYGIRLLEILRTHAEVQTHLVISTPGKRTIVEETAYALKDVEALATHHYDNRDIGAPIASGSFRTAGMVIAPCSIKTAGAMASGSRSRSSSWTMGAVTAAPRSSASSARRTGACGSCA